MSISLEPCVHFNSSQVNTEYCIANSDDDIYFLSANGRQSIKLDQDRNRCLENHPLLTECWEARTFNYSMSFLSQQQFSYVFLGLAMGRLGDHDTHVSAENLFSSQLQGAG